MISLSKLTTIALTALISVILNSVVAEDKSCELLEDYVCSNSPSACDCSEPNLNCDNCNEGNSIPCSQCISGYFRAFSNYKCVSCDELFGNSCDHCTNDRGCQQCVDSSQQPQMNDCGLYTCDDTVSVETPSPTRSPSIIPSLNPTVQPTTMVQLFNTFFEEYYGPNADPFDDTQLTPEFEVCVGEIGCGGVDFYNKLGGICDEGAMVSTSDITLRDDIYLFVTFTVCCDSSVNGRFWLNSVQFVELVYESDGSRRLVKNYINYLDETDVDYVREYLES